jgi:hypothetical protein
MGNGEWGREIVARSHCSDGDLAVAMGMRKYYGAEEIMRT